MTWVNDTNGNRASSEYFGSEEAARASLATLENCRNCENCSDCSGCSRCSGCSGCSHCSDCSGCSHCSHCSGCSHISLLFNKENLAAEPAASAASLGAPAVPRIENIHQRVYAAVSQPNAFDMGGWHTTHSCGTIHCRGGWVVTLAGEAGKALEDFHNPELAAMLIYYESGYHINPARFYDSNEVAMDDMRRLAEEEAAAAASVES